MAKFEIEAKIGANSKEFEAKMKAAAAESREFAKQVHENMSQLKDVFDEVAGEAGLGKVTKMFGSATAAAGIFAAAVAAACIDGVKEFEKLEDQAFKFGQLLHDKGKGMAVAKEIEEEPGHMGNKDELVAGRSSLIEAAQALGEKDPAAWARQYAKVLENVSAQTGKSYATMAEQLRNFVSGGEEAQKNGAKLAKGIPTLSALIKQKENSNKGMFLRDLESQRSMQTYQLGQMPSNTDAYREKYEKLQDLDKQIDAKKTGKEYDVSSVLKNIKPGEVLGLLNKEYGPGGKSGKAADEKGDTVSGKFEDLKAAIDRCKTALGEGLAPAAGKIAEELVAEMPTIKEAAHTLGETLSKLTPAISAVIQFIDGHIPHRWGEQAGGSQGKAYMHSIGYREDANGNAVPFKNAAGRDMFDQTDVRNKLQNSGMRQAEVFESNTGGKDLQSDQLAALNSIDQNTKNMDVK